MTKKQQPILIVGILIVIAAIIYFVSQGDKGKRSAGDSSAPIVIPTYTIGQAK